MRNQHAARGEMREPIAGAMLLLILCLVYACVVQYSIVADVIRQETAQQLLLQLNGTAARVLRARSFIYATQRLAALGD